MDWYQLLCTGTKVEYRYLHYFCCWNSWILQNFGGCIDTSERVLVLKFDYRYSPVLRLCIEGSIAITIDLTLSFSLSLSLIYLRHKIEYSFRLLHLLPPLSLSIACSPPKPLLLLSLLSLEAQSQPKLGIGVGEVEEEFLKSSTLYPKIGIQKQSLEEISSYSLHVKQCVFEKFCRM